MPMLSGSGLRIWWLGNSHKANDEGRNHFYSAQVTGASSLPLPPLPWQQGPRTFTMDPDLTLCRSLGPDITVVIALLVWLQSHCGPPTSTWQLRPEQHMAPGGSLGHPYQLLPYYLPFSTSASLHSARTTQRLLSQFLTYAPTCSS